MIFPPVIITVLNEAGIKKFCPEIFVAPKIIPKWVFIVPFNLSPTNGIIKVSNEVQPENALSPILVTLSGINMLVMLEKLMNPQSSIALTGNPLYVDGMTTEAAVAEPLEIEYAVLLLISVKRRFTVGSPVTIGAVG